MDDLEHFLLSNFKMRFISAILALILSPFGAAEVIAQQQIKQFHPSAIRAFQDLPQSRFRNQIERLPAQARDRAIAWLGNIHFTEGDLKTMQIDSSGGVFFADPVDLPMGIAATSAEPQVAAAAVPVSPFPAHLVFHSKPGAPNVLFLNFSGDTVSGTSWNDDLGRTSIPAVAFSTDSDLTTFSDAEQLAIRRIWQRVSEDYAPFNIDVTTERPATFSTRTAHALITRHTDASGADNPAPSSGGVAYVGVFGSSGYAKYRPAWIYFDNLASQESFIAEAASHEVGHNLGLTHDGKTDGTDYYGGHGSGATSWGPIMGTGYNRNVSQWSKGEYYLANNTQDDLATIAGKISYRTDDHGNTLGSATALTISADGSIASTTPETDPGNTNRVNKGILERSSDIDVFSFATGTGSVNLSVKPWSVPNGLTAGGDVDLIAELYNAAGQLLLTNNAADATAATIQTNLTEGVYYLMVKSTGVGNPTNSTPTGYTKYASIGQFFISGNVVSSTVAIPPGAELDISDVTDPGSSARNFTVTYSDDVAIDVATIGANDIRVTGPNGYNRLATFLSVDLVSNGSPRMATYKIDAPSGVWTEADNGIYTVSIEPNSVSDTSGASVPAAVLGTFKVAVPRAIYFASMDTNPGWTMSGLWQYGAPRYPSGTGPTKGFTGANIIAYNLSGNYENRLAPVYATTPTINSSGASTLTLRFQRWLRVRNGDTANIQVSINGTTWTDLWSSSRPVSDNSWQSVQYALPASVAGSSSLQIRWGMASGQAQNDIGWNIDDVVVLGNGSVDTTPPAAALSVANLTMSGSPTHTFTVTYTDDVAVSIGSLGATDLLVVGPNGTNAVEYVGIDTPSDGTPRSALYSISAPNGLWTSADNGDYQVYLQDGEVSDPSNNFAEPALLGTFKVAIANSQQAIVVEPKQLLVPEGSQTNFTLRLAEQPSANVTVIVRSMAEDPDIIVTSATTNIFTPQDWNVPIQITVSALVDADHENGMTTIICESDALAPVSIIVTEQDKDTALLPPSISLLTPASGATFQTTDLIEFSAEASDDGSVTKVEFFANDILVGTSAASPFVASANLKAGTYSITARATDNLGLATTSNPIGIKVIEPAIVPPPQLTSISDSLGVATLTLSTSSTAPHILQVSSDLQTWTSVTTNLPTSGTITFTYTSSASKEFFRVAVAAP